MPPQEQLPIAQGNQLQYVGHTQKKKFNIIESVVK